MEPIEQQPKTLVDMVAQIDEWLAAQDRTGNADQLAGILRTVVKLSQDDAGRGDLKILNRAMQELRHAFRIFAPYRHQRKVSIFGSTRVAESDPYYALARNVATGAGASRVNGDHRRRPRHHASRP